MAGVFMITDGANNSGSDPRAAANRLDVMLDMYKRDSVWGTPDECMQRVEGINDLIGPSEIIFITSEGSMPVEKTQSSISPIQNWGMAMKPIAKNLEIRSNQPSWRTAASTPTKTPTAIPRISE